MYNPGISPPLAPLGCVWEGGGGHDKLATTSLGPHTVGRLTLRASMTASAISTATPSWASTVEAPRWGVTITSGLPTRGWSAGGGSTANTSSAAPATILSSRALAKATSSMTPPRATLTMRAPFLILLKASVPKMPYRQAEMLNEQNDACLR